ncbi:hypothetical protein LZD49_15620 [Dyadobacter sp. CY261]|nr:hypothetical protein [Dyadobacter sp. CY261]
MQKNYDIWKVRISGRVQNIQRITATANRYEVTLHFRSTYLKFTYHENSKPWVLR